MTMVAGRTVPRASDSDRTLRMNKPDDDRGRNAASPGDLAKSLLSFAQETAATHKPPVECFSLGPLEIEVSVIGDIFRRRLTTAIEFARVKNFEPTAKPWRIIAIDGVASGAGNPPAPHPDFADYKQAARSSRERDPQIMLRFIPSPPTWRLVSARQHLAVTWTADAALFPDWEDSAPFRDLFHLMSLSTECFLAHAAAIGIGGSGILLIGPGGSGKSTTTGAAVLRGFSSAGDDFVLVDPQSARVYSLYDAIKLNPKSARWLPDLARQIVNPQHAPDEKGRVHIYQSRRSAFAHSLPITAILLPHISGEPRTTISPASQSAAALALIPSTMLLLDGGEAVTMHKSASFLRRVPAYHCRLGPDPFEAIDAISAFVDGLSK